MPPAGFPKLSGILACWIFVFLWVFFTNYCLRPYKFWKGYLPYVPYVQPSCASSDCRERELSLVDRCTIIILQIRSFRAFGTILRHFQSGNTEHHYPLVALFTTAHDICM